MRSIVVALFCLFFVSLFANSRRAHSSALHFFTLILHANVSSDAAAGLQAWHHSRADWTAPDQEKTRPLPGKAAPKHAKGGVEIDPQVRSRNPQALGPISLRIEDQVTFFASFSSDVFSLVSVLAVDLLRRCCLTASSKANRSRTGFR